MQWPADTAYKLHIENCIFTGNTLRIEWLPVLNTKIILSQLYVKTTVPITIEENAFSDNIFQNIRTLKIEGSIEQLKYKCFAGLHNLDTLEIYEGLIQYVAGGILKDVQNLSSLRIESGISDDHLNYFLQNITLQNLQELNIRFNHFKTLKSGNLRGLTNLLTLNAGWSHITSIDSTILESSANKIEKVIFAGNELETLPVDIFNIKSKTNFQVFLQQNKLKTLPEGIFDVAIKSSGRVEVHLEDNDWHCDCDLAWLQNYIEKEIIHVGGEPPKCASPEIKKDKSLIDADFSDCITTTLPSASSTTTTETTASSTTETVTSETTTPTTTETTFDSATSTTDTTTESSPTTTENMTTNTITTSTELSTHTTTSSIGDTDNNTASSTEVTTDTTTSSTEEGYTLLCNCTTCSRKNIYFLTESSSVISPLTMRGIKSFTIEENEVTGEITARIEAETEHLLVWTNNNNNCNYTEFNPLKQPSFKYTTFKTARNTSYIICAARMISEQVATVPPLNCRAHTTLLSPEDRPFLFIKDKYITLAISCFALLVIVVISGAICYNVVLYNPKLLKGNKRVMVVHRHECAVGLAPHGENDKPRSSQTTYSTASTDEASYVTLDEPTTVEQSALKFRGMCDTLSDYKTESAIVFFPKQEPPPLPLYRMSCTSDTRGNTEPNSENNYVIINESTTLRVMTWLFNQMRDELPYNCTTEDANESHF